MFGQLNINGLDKIETAIKRIQAFEPKEGYYFAFSGGKDSIVIKHLCNMAGVKYDAHYNITSVDPAELFHYMREYHKDVIFEYPRYKDDKQITMWNLIAKQTMLATRVIRYCCKYLKEGGGNGRFVITGVRWSESARRKNSRSGLEVATNNKRQRFLDAPDNPVTAQIHICLEKGKTKKRVRGKAMKQIPITKIKEVPEGKYCSQEGKEDYECTYYTHKGGWQCKLFNEGLACRFGIQDVLKCDQCRKLSEVKK